MLIDRRGMVRALAASLLPLGPGRAVAAAAPRLLQARKGVAAVAGTPGVEIWGYEGRVPGPVLRLRRGDPLSLRLVNKLDQPTTLSWTGLRAPNAMDGVGGLTQAPVPPGGQFDYAFTPPDSGLAWIRPHVGTDTLGQIARGLSGVLVVEEIAPPAVDDDRVLVLQDWTLTGKVAEAPAAGSTPLVTADGAALPLAAELRPGARMRLRLLNATGGAIVQVSFEGFAAAMVVAIDGQPSEIFQPMRGIIPIGPGSRFELMLDLPRQAGSARLRLQRAASAPQDLLVITAKGAPVPSRPPIAKLPDNPALPTQIRLERAMKREIVVALRGPDAWSLASGTAAGGHDAPLFRVRRGEPVSLALNNASDAPQQMHVHGHVFRVLHDLDDGWDPYWRDTILLAPRKTKHVAFVADNPGKWAIESLMLDRQAAGLFGWFDVV